MSQILHPVSSEIAPVNGISSSDAEITRLRMLLAESSRQLQEQRSQCIKLEESLHKLDEKTVRIQENRKEALQLISEVIMSIDPCVAHTVLNIDSTCDTMSRDCKYNNLRNTYTLLTRAQSILIDALEPSFPSPISSLKCGPSSHSILLNNVGGDLSVRGCDSTLGACTPSRTNSSRLKHQYILNSGQIMSNVSSFNNCVNANQSSFSASNSLLSDNIDDKNPIQNEEKECTKVISSSSCMHLPSEAMRRNAKSNETSVDNQNTISNKNQLIHICEQNIKNNQKLYPIQQNDRETEVSDLSDNANMEIFDFLDPDQSPNNNMIDNKGIINSENKNNNTHNRRESNEIDNKNQLKHTSTNSNHYASNTTTTSIQSSSPSIHADSSSSKQKIQCSSSSVLPSSSSPPKQSPSLPPSSPSTIPPQRQIISEVNKQRLRVSSFHQDLSRLQKSIGLPLAQLEKAIRAAKDVLSLIMPHPLASFPADTAHHAGASNSLPSHLLAGTGSSGNLTGQQNSTFPLHATSSPFLPCNRAFQSNATPSNGIRVASLANSISLPTPTYLPSRLLSSAVASPASAQLSLPSKPSLPPAANSSGMNLSRAPLPLFAPLPSALDPSLLYPTPPRLSPNPSASPPTSKSPFANEVPPFPPLLFHPEPPFSSPSMPSLPAAPLSCSSHRSATWKVQSRPPPLDLDVMELSLHATADTSFDSNSQRTSLSSPCVPEQETKLIDGLEAGSDNSIINNVSIMVSNNSNISTASCNLSFSNHLNTSRRKSTSRLLNFPHHDSPSTTNLYPQSCTDANSNTVCAKIPLYEVNAGSATGTTTRAPSTSASTPLLLDSGIRRFSSSHDENNVDEKNMDMVVAALSSLYPTSTSALTSGSSTSSNREVFHNIALPITSIDKNSLTSPILSIPVASSTATISNENVVNSIDARQSLTSATTSIRPSLPNSSKMHTTNNDNNQQQQIHVHSSKKSELPPPFPSLSGRCNLPSNDTSECSLTRFLQSPTHLSSLPPHPPHPRVPFSSCTPRDTPCTSQAVPSSALSTANRMMMLGSGGTSPSYPTSAPLTLAYASRHLEEAVELCSKVAWAVKSSIDVARTFADESSQLVPSSVAARAQKAATVARMGEQRRSFHVELLLRQVNTLVSRLADLQKIALGRPANSLQQHSSHPEPGSLRPILRATTSDSSLLASPPPSLPSDKFISSSIAGKRGGSSLTMSPSCEPSLGNGSGSHCRPSASLTSIKWTSLENCAAAPACNPLLTPPTSGALVPSALPDSPPSRLSPFECSETPSPPRLSANSSAASSSEDSPPQMITSMSSVSTNSLSDAGMLKNATTAAITCLYRRRDAFNKTPHHQSNDTISSPPFVSNNSRHNDNSSQDEDDVDNYSSPSHNETNKSCNGAVDCCSISPLKNKNNKNNEDVINSLHTTPSTTTNTPNNNNKNHYQQQLCHPYERLSKLGINSDDESSNEKINPVVHLPLASLLSTPPPSTPPRGSSGPSFISTPHPQTSRIFLTPLHDHAGPLVSPSSMGASLTVHAEEEGLHDEEEDDASVITTTSSSSANHHAKGEFTGHFQGSEPVNVKDNIQVLGKRRQHQSTPLPSPLSRLSSFLPTLPLVSHSLELLQSKSSIQEEEDNNDNSEVDLQTPPPSNHSKHENLTVLLQTSTSHSSGQSCDSVGCASSTKQNPRLHIENELVRTEVDLSSSVLTSHTTSFFNLSTYPNVHHSMQNYLPNLIESEESAKASLITNRKSEGYSDQSR